MFAIWHVFALLLKSIRVSYEEIICIIKIPGKERRGLKTRYWDLKKKVIKILGFTVAYSESIIKKPSIGPPKKQ